jgi:hypothetical protein
MTIRRTAEYLVVALGVLAVLAECVEERDVSGALLAGNAFLWVVVLFVRDKEHDNGKS